MTDQTMVDNPVQTVLPPEDRSGEGNTFDQLNTLLEKIVLESPPDKRLAVYDECYALQSALVNEISRMYGYSKMTNPETFEKGFSTSVLATMNPTDPTHAYVLQRFLAGFDPNKINTEQDILTNLAARSKAVSGFMHGADFERRTKDGNCTAHLEMQNVKPDGQRNTYNYFYPDHKPELKRVELSLQFDQKAAQGICKEPVLNRMPTLATRTFNAAYMSDLTR